MERRLVTVAVMACSVLLGACGSDGGSPSSSVPLARLEIMAVAGPVCPVETDPPSPECAPRPVESAEVVLTDREGNEVVTGITGPGGVLLVDVAPGAITIVPQAVEGLLGTAPPVSVVAVGGETVFAQIDYDTGIR